MPAINNIPQAMIDEHIAWHSRPGNPLPVAEESIHFRHLAGGLHWDPAKSFWFGTRDSFSVSTNG